MIEIIENKLLQLFSSSELSHISLWRDSGKWVLLKKKPHQDERIYIGATLIEVVNQALI
jgi:hypothetical protein